MKKLRPVEFWVRTKDNKHTGFFHCWGQRGDKELTDFFGVVEDEEGLCYELDPCQIKFTDNNSLKATSLPDRERTRG